MHTPRTHTHTHMHTYTHTCVRCNKTQLVFQTPLHVRTQLEQRTVQTYTLPTKCGQGQVVGSILTHPITERSATSQQQPKTTSLQFQSKLD